LLDYPAIDDHAWFSAVLDEERRFDIIGFPACPEEGEAAENEVIAHSAVPRLRCAAACEQSVLKDRPSSRIIVQ